MKYRIRKVINKDNKIRYRVQRRLFLYGILYQLIIVNLKPILKLNE